MYALLFSVLVQLTDSDHIAFPSLTKCCHLQMCPQSTNLAASYLRWTFIGQY